MMQQAPLRSARSKRFVLTLVVGMALATAGAVSAAISSTATLGFAPLLAVWGNDQVRALSELRATLDLFRVVLADTRLEDKLSRVLQATTDSLVDFDLETAYELMPEPNGSARELRVAAGRSGNQYLVRMAAPGEAFEANAAGKRRRLGDASLHLRMTPSEHDGDDHYLVNARAAAAVGGMTWPDVLTAHSTWLHLLAQTRVGTDPKQRPLTALRQSTLAANPKLDADEIEALATLSEAFPSTARLLSSVVRVDNLHLDDPDGRARHMRVDLRMTPERMRESYPALAEYASDLDRIVRVAIQVRDAQGRMLARWNLDTHELRGRVEFHVADGKLVPFDAKHVYVDAPLDLQHTAQDLSLHADVDVHMLGVHARIQHLRGKLKYTPSPQGARLAASVTQVPTIKIDGNALGFVPTGLIDVFVPGDLNGLATKLATALCRGNAGRGVVVDTELAHGADSVSTLEGSVALELLDNYLIGLGVGYWNDHLRPNTEVQAELARLLRDSHKSLSADVHRFAWSARTRGQ